MPQIGREFCFLCGRGLPAQRHTDEHVIPRWIQQRYDLWNLRLTLLNRTTIPYRQLTIPCCATCNNEHLGRIEAQVQAACDEGREAVLQLPTLTLFLWAGKIFYGLLYREHLLSWSRREPDRGPIVPAEVLKRYRLHHQFLQAARITFEFNPHVPASIFVYDTLEPTERQMQFDYWDNIPGMGLSIRVGKVGIIVCVQDGGAVKYSFEKVYERIGKLKLHWAQFAEVTARTFYDLSRFNRVPKFLLVEGKDKVHVVMNPLGGLSGKPLFENWNMQDYAKALAFYFRCSEEQIHPEPHKVVSWLFRAGRLRRMRPDDPA